MLLKLVVAVLLSSIQTFADTDVKAPEVRLKGSQAQELIRALVVSGFSVKFSGQEKAKRKIVAQVDFDNANGHECDVNDNAFCGLGPQMNFNPTAGQEKQVTLSEPEQLFNIFKKYVQPKLDQVKYDNHGGGLGHYETYYGVATCTWVLAGENSNTVTNPRCSIQVAESLNPT